MLILLLTTSIILKKICPASPMFIPETEQKTAGIEDVQTRNRTQAVQSVPEEDELEFYKLANKIKPETLKFLMPSISEAPYVHTPPSNHCCFNGGTCYVPTYERDDRYCTCPPAFTGRFCFEDVDECLSPDACAIHEICKNTYGSYSCSCEEGFIREASQCIRKSNCFEDPCLNFSECIDLEEGRVLCHCRLGFKGSRCEIEVQECEDSSCNEDEICVASPNGFYCIKH